MDAITEDPKAYAAAVARMNTSIFVATARLFQDTLDHPPAPGSNLAAEILAEPALRELTHEQLYEYAVHQTGVAIHAVRSAVAARAVWP